MIVVREALALVTRSDRNTAVLASGTVYKSVSVAALGIKFFLKYLFAMSTPVRKRTAWSQ